MTVQGISLEFMLVVVWVVVVLLINTLLVDKSVSAILILPIEFL